MNAQELVELAMERTGARSAPALAKALRMEPGSDANIRRWRRGAASPHFDETMLLLRAAGLLREEPEAAERATQDDPLDARLQELSEQVAESVRLSKQALQAVLRAERRSAAAPRGQRRSGNASGDG